MGVHPAVTTGTLRALLDPPPPPCPRSPLTVAVPETVCALVSAALCSEWDCAGGYRFSVCSGTVVWPGYSGAGWGWGAVYSAGMPF